MSRRALRWIRNGLLAVLGLVALALVLVHAALMTDRGRDFVRVRVVSLLSEALGGELAIERIEALSAFHLRARGLRLQGHDGELLAAVKRVDAGVAPLALVWGRVHLTHVTLEDAFVELGAPLEAEGGGGLPAFFEKSPDEESQPESASSGVTVVIDRLELHRARAQAMVDGTACAVRALDVAGRLELAEGLDVRLSRVHGELERAGVAIGAIEHAIGEYSGRGSRVDTAVRVGQSRLWLKGRLAPLDSRGAQPLRASVRGQAISRESLAALGLVGEWPRTPVELQADATGDTTALDATIALQAREGHADAKVHFAQAAGVRLDQLRARSGSVVLSAQGELARDGAIVLDARVDSSDLGAAPLLNELVAGVAGELGARMSFRRSAAGVMDAAVDARWERARIASASARSLRIAGDFHGTELSHARSRVSATIDQLDAGPLKLARTQLALRGEPDRYRLEGQLGERGFVRASAQRRDSSWLLDGALDLTLTPPHGALRVAARARGPLPTPRVTLTGAYRCPRFEGLHNAALDVVVDADLRTRRIHGDARLLADGTSARLTTDTRLRALTEQGLRRARHEIALDVDRLPLHALERWPRAPAVPKSAVLTGKVNAAGTLSDYTIETALHVSSRFAQGDAPLDAWLDGAYSKQELALKLRASDRRGPLIRTQIRTELAGPRAALDRASIAQLIAQRSWTVSLWLGARRIDELPSTRALGVPEQLWPARVSADVKLEHRPGVEPIGELRARLAWDPPGKTSDAPLCGLGRSPYLALATKMGQGELHATLSAGSAGRDGVVVTYASHAPMDEWLQIKPAQIRPVSLDALFTDFELGDVPVVCERVRGTIAGRARLSRALTEAVALHAQLRGRALRFIDAPPVDVALEADAREQKITGKGTIAAKGGSAELYLELPLDGGGRVPSVPTDQPVRLDARFHTVPAAALVGAVPNVHASSGTLGGWIGVRDTLAQPTLRGRIDIREVTLTLGELGQRFERATGTLAIDGRKLTMSHLRFADLGGRADVSGELTLHTLEPLAFDARFEAKAKALPIRRSGVMAAHLDGTLGARIQVKPERVDVLATLRKARIELADAATTQPQSLEPNPDIVFAGEPGPEAERATTPVHLRIDASQPFWVRRSDFSALVSTDLTIESGKDGASVVGTVEVQRGTVELLGQLFDIERGTITFSGGHAIEPTLELAASRRIPGAGGALVRVEARGPVNSPELAFEVDGRPATAGDALAAALGTRAGPGGDANVQEEFSSLATGIAGSVLTLGARRELGPWVPVLALERGAGETRVRAGVEADRFIPSFMRKLVVDAYVEGIVTSQEQTEGGQVTDESNTGAAALLELRFPHDLTTEAQYGPGQRWSLDLGWEP